ncbi:hypothetical protein [Actinomadura rudentiformis]|uniref:Uncharacterized protein n=1 Tax=Actinomadura rudentiformis TaxID=359158 RepID=A0A6H9YC79_9ACTN|nr:hypothetical protein [Actinomadura rudentiformis]KAB2341611.1 hypothetical protein F8566_41510 [Actinomadura rudentiformis]
MTSTPHQPGGRGPGLFIPQHVIVGALCLLLGALAAVLVWLAPAVWLPIGAGIAVTGLALALYNHWHGRHHV